MFENLANMEIKKKKVAIVGTAGTHKECPYNDPSFEIWGVNNGYMLMPRYTRWFEIHNITKHDDGHFYRRGSKDFRGQTVDDYVKALSKLKVPVYMQQHWDEAPNSVPYPLGEVVQMFGSIMGWYNAKAPEGRPTEYMAYFTNTISYMIALAIYEGFEEIHVYGVDMAVDTEYHVQRPSCEFFVGWAIGKGIKVYITPNCELLRSSYLYAFGEHLYETDKQFYKEKCRDLDQRIDQVRQAKEINMIKENQLIGARTAYEEIKKRLI